MPFLAGAAGAPVVGRAAVPCALRRRSAALSSSSSGRGRGVETIFVSGSRLRRRRRPVAGRPTELWTHHLGVHRHQRGAASRVRWHQRPRCARIARRRRSAAQTVVNASAASREPPTDASGCPTRAEGCGAALHVKYGPLQGADAGHRAERDITGKDAGHVSTLYPKELQTQQRRVYGQKSDGDDATADDARICGTHRKTEGR